MENNYEMEIQIKTLKYVAHFVKLLQILLNALLLFQ